MTRVLGAYLAKERRDGRALLVGIPATMTAALVIGSFLVPDRFLRDPFFFQVAGLGGIALGLLAVAADVVPGEARRETMRFLARLPAGLGTAWIAKAIHVLLALAFLGATGLAAGRLVQAAWGVPLVPEGGVWWMLYGRTHWLPPVLVLVGAGGWVLAVSTWLPRGSLAIPAAALALGAFGLPLWLLYRSAPGLWPYEGFVLTFAIALVVAPFAIGAWSFVRGRRHGGGPWSSAWRGLIATAVLFAPAWAFAAFEALDWLTVEPSSDRFRIGAAHVGEGGRFLYLDAGMTRRLGPEALGPRRPLVVDLETGRWETAGEPGDRFEAAQGEPFGAVSLMTVRDAAASAASPGGKQVWRRYLDAATAEIVKSGWEHLRHPELDRYGPHRPSEVPEGYRAAWPCGLGWSAWRDKKRWFWDPFRGKAYVTEDFRGLVWVRIRPGRWVAYRSFPHPPGWVLVDPETRSETPLDAPGGTYVAAVVADGRVLVTTGGASRLVDPETMEGEAVDLPGEFVHALGRTGDGGEILRCYGRVPEGHPTSLGVFRLDVATGKLDALGGPDGGREGIEPFAAVGEDAVLAIQDGRKIVRLRRGSEEAEVLFPRGAGR